MYTAGMHDSWTHARILEAVRKLVRESNSLFEDMAKKVKDYPDLGTMLRDILFCGKGIPFNLGTELVSIGAMFCFLKDDDGQVAISNRIFEIWFYNLFIAQDAIDSKTYKSRECRKFILRIIHWLKQWCDILDNSEAPRNSKAAEPMNLLASL